MAVVGKEAISQADITAFLVKKNIHTIRETGDGERDIVDDEDENVLRSSVLLHRLFPHVMWLRKEEKELAMEHGLEIKMGRFSDEENKRLKKNFRRQKRRVMREIGDEAECQKRIDKLLGHNSNNTNCGGFKKDQLKFLLGLGHKLPNRLLRGIYDRARNTLSSVRTMKNLTPKEKKKVLKLHKKYGNDHAKIAKIVNCQPKAVIQIVRINFDEYGNLIKRTRWTREEDQELLLAIKKELGIKNLAESLDKPIPWAEVAKHLRGRSRLSCQYRFRKGLRWRIGSSDDDFLREKDESQHRDDLAKILYFIHKENVKREIDIDWDHLKRLMPDLSLRYIFRYWEELKEKVADEMKGSHRKRISYLMDHELPRLLRYGFEAGLIRLRDFIETN